MSSVSPVIQKTAALLILALALVLLFNAAWLAFAHRNALIEEIAFLEQRQAQLTVRAAELGRSQEQLKALEEVVARDPSLASFGSRKEAEDLLHKTLRDLAQAHGLQLIHLRPVSVSAEAAPITAQVRLRGRESAALAFVQKLLSGSPRVLAAKLNLSLQQQMPDPANTLVQVEADVQLPFRGTSK